MQGPLYFLNDQLLQKGNWAFESFVNLGHTRGRHKLMENVCYEKAMRGFQNFFGPKYKGTSKGCGQWD